MSDGAKQEILEALREVVERLEELGTADAISFGQLIVTLAGSAGHEAQSVREISDPLLLEAARSFSSSLREFKETETSPRTMWIQSIDQDGNPLSESKQITVPAPELVSQDGLAHLDEYVSRLYRSGATFASLIIFRQDRQVGLSVLRRGGATTLSLTVNWRQHPQQEQAIRQFFDSRRLPPAQDYLSGHGGLANDLRIFAYPGGDTAEHTADLCRRFLQEVCGITEPESLLYLFQEN